MQELVELVEAMSQPRVVLLGDYMLDRWVYGNTDRLSQEAPVPILHVTRSDERAGAAGNVAAAIVALGGRADCVGAIGADDEGLQVMRLLADAGAGTEGMLSAPDRQTTVKTRYVGLAQHKNEQQILRVDSEVTDGLAPAVWQELLAKLTGRLVGDGVLVKVLAG